MSRPLIGSFARTASTIHRAPCSCSSGAERAVGQPAQSSTSTLRRPHRRIGPMNRERLSWLMDMDGVIVREEHLVPGADQFVARLAATGHPFLILTNNSMFTTRDLAARLGRLGLDVSPDRIWTSALATAKFLDDQRPDGSAFVIGVAGLTTALYEAGYTLVESDPDYVVLGETRTYSLSL